jgi:hypothetical protein
VGRNRKGVNVVLIRVEDWQRAHSESTSRRTTRGVRVSDAPGGHSSMLQEPHVSVLAERMQSYIDNALAEKPVARLKPALAGPSTYTSGSVSTTC